MMVTVAQVQGAHRLAPLHRFALRGLMKVDETKATPEDLVLVGKIRAVKTPAEYDAICATKEANSLYLRGVTYFGENR